ncbi:MFS transporter [Salmonella enterica]|nr:MFS transporter [Salmonella enterica subsp. diarizonae]EJM2521359.1 MFS transporter [Salmonella enterica]
MYKIKNSIFAASCVASILFIAITTLGLSLATLPLYVSESLGYSAFYVGLVVSTESLSTLFSRAAAGRYSDNHGPRKGMVLGLLLTFLSGLFCLFSFSVIDSAKIAFSIIIFSRILMGIGESLIFTCSGTWPIGLVGREHAGKIMSWVGIAMFLGLALGNYVGTWSYYHTGIIISAIAMTILPALGFLLVAIVKPVATHPKRSEAKLAYAIQRIWKAGSGFSLANIGYASITTFLVLYFIQNGWEKQAALALALFGVGYVVSRLTLGWKADSSGLKLTLFSIFIEALGLLFIAFSYNPYVAMLGAFLTGFGLSMIYPLLALPALKSMPDENIGLALSTYESCFDIGILVAGLVGGGIVSLFGYPSIFIFAFFCCLLASISSVLAYNQISNEDPRLMP